MGGLAPRRAFLPTRHPRPVSDRLCFHECGVAACRVTCLLVEPALTFVARFASLSPGPASKTCSGDSILTQPALPCSAGMVLCARRPRRPTALLAREEGIWAARMWRVFCLELVRIRSARARCACCFIWRQPCFCWGAPVLIAHPVSPLSAGGPQSTWRARPPQYRIASCWHVRLEGRD